MVAAMVKGKRVEIENLDDLAEAVETSRQARASLILIGEHDERLEFDPAKTFSAEERRAAFEASFGSWKGLVDTEKLKRDIYASRGQRGRDFWKIMENADDQE